MQTPATEAVRRTALAMLSRAPRDLKRPFSVGRDAVVQRLLRSKSDHSLEPSSLTGSIKQLRSTEIDSDGGSGMTTTNTQSGTNVHEVAEGIFRINTPVPPSVIPGGFSFNQFLLVGEEPLLFHSGPRKMFPLVSEAVRSLLPVESLRHIAFSHFEADECGSLNEWLAISPHAQPVCGRVAALVSVDDVADRPARALGDGEVLATGGHSLKWLDAPHLPHGWETGYLFEENTRTLLCGDLFTQPGRGESPVTEDDILEPSEAFRGKMDYFSYSKNAPALLERLATTEPTTLACMHGSVWRGDGATLLRALSGRLSGE